MDIRNLGHSGLRVSAVGIGCNNFGARVDVEGTRKVIYKAIDMGITLFDTADVYGERGGSETAMGQVLGDKRKDIVLATKFASPLNREKDSRYNGSRGYIMKAVEDSLRRLKTDWIDLYQYHFPDPRTPIEETLRALDDLVRQGKVRYIGCSNLPGWQLVDAAWTARHHGLHRFVSTQAELSLLTRGAEKDLVPAIAAANMSLLPYFPLASGLLTGKYRKGEALPADSRMSMPYFQRGMTDQRLDTVERLIAFAEARGHTILELAMSWLVGRPAVGSVIAGATRPEQVRANAASVGRKLTAEDLAEVDAMTSE